MYSLLTSNNTKTNKSVQYGYITGILHLSPSTMAGLGNMCPKASAGCKLACLNTAGHGGMFIDIKKSKIQNARKRRTELFVKHREDFMLELYCDIRKAIRYAESNGLVPVFRLNGTSDMPFEKMPLLGYKNIFEAFPAVQFYDYTKIYRRLHTCKGISNYHLTFSRSEDNDHEVKKCIESGHNVAVVFNKVPSVYMGLEVVDGDLHDLRFLDKSGVIVGLKAKGKARKDTSGFVVRCEK